MRQEAVPADSQFLQAQGLLTLFVLKYKDPGHRITGWLCKGFPLRGMAGRTRQWTAKLMRGKNLPNFINLRIAAIHFIPLFAGLFPAQIHDALGLPREALDSFGLHQADGNLDAQHRLDPVVDAPL